MDKYPELNLYQLTKFNQKFCFKKFIFILSISLGVICSFFFIKISKEIEFMGIASCQKEFCEFTTTLNSSYNHYLKEVNQIKFANFEKIRELRFSNPTRLNQNQIVEDVTFVVSNLQLKNQEINTGKIILGTETIANKIWNIWKGGEKNDVSM